MRTISWNDIACTEVTGPVRFHDYTILISPEHVAQWKADPDGRFKLTPSPDESTAELEKFYPSL